MWEDSTRAMTNIRQNFALPVSGLNQQWTLADRPVGREVRLSDFELVTRPLPPLRDGEVLVRTLYLSVAPVMRQYCKAVRVSGRCSWVRRCAGAASAS